jgi:hypothetical protein
MRDLRSRVKVSSVIPFRNKDMIDAILIKFSSYTEQSDTILYVRDSSIQKKSCLPYWHAYKLSKESLLLNMNSPSAGLFHLFKFMLIIWLLLCSGKLSQSLYASNDAIIVEGKTRWQLFFFLNFWHLIGVILKNFWVIQTF